MFVIFVVVYVSYLELTLSRTDENTNNLKSASKITEYNKIKMSDN